ncbi:MAG: hypothetical protein R2737_15400 [Candidatus Nanopelagicales bacterium]
MATEAPSAPAPAEPAPKKKFRFPTAFTVLFFVLLIVWGLTFIIKPGSYAYVSCDGGNAKPIPGTYEQVELDIPIADRIYDLLLSPVNGLYGIRVPPGALDEAPPADLDAKAAAACGEGVPYEVVTPPGFTGPYESGDLAGAVQVFYFVLCIGAFITVTMKTGALDAGIARITHRFRTRGLLLITILMVIFSIGGTTYGMAEETLGFYALLVPIMVGLGFDRMVGAVTIMVGAGVGTLASTVNPFATGVASGAADIPLGDGIGLRLLMYITLTIIAILYVLRYARKVKKNPEKSLVRNDPRGGVGEEALDEMDEAAAMEEPPVMTGRQKAVMWVFGLTFVLMIFSVIPWGDFFESWSEPLSKVFMPWYFPELAALFLIGSVVIGLIGGLGEEGMVSGIIQGMGDFMGAALIIAIARGVTVIMNNSGITDTVLNSLAEVVAGLSAAVFGIMMYVVNIPLAFLVPSSSGHATLAMPIMAPLADFAGVSRAIVVTAYQSASGWVNLFTPTSAIVMGGLALAKVGYDRYIRFVWPLLVILFVGICAFLALGVAVPALGGPVN